MNEFKFATSAPADGKGSLHLRQSTSVSGGEDDGDGGAALGSGGGGGGSSAAAVGLPPPGGIIGSPDTSAVPFRGMTKSITISGKGNLSSIPSSGAPSRPTVTFGGLSVGGPSSSGGDVASSMGHVNLSLAKPAFKRVQSVAGIDSFKKASSSPPGGGDSIDPLVAAKMGAAGEFGHMLDDRARSQLAQNVWWRSYALQHRRSKSSDGAISIGGSAGGIYVEAGNEGSTGEISTAQDALSVEGVDRDHKKQWEEYYLMFLERYATQGDDLLARLSGSASSSAASPSGGKGSGDEAVGFVGGANERSMSMDSCDSSGSSMGFGRPPPPSDTNKSLVTAETTKGGGGEGTSFGSNLDESVHGGNLFAAFMRSGDDDGATNVLSTPTGSTENFANYAFPWEVPGGGGAGGGYGAGGDGGLVIAGGDGAKTVSSSSSSGLGPGGDEIKLERSGSSSSGVHIPRQQLRTIDSGEEMNAGPSIPALFEAHATSTTSQGGNIETILKKAFTGFHNSSKFGQDNASAYLGDDLSVRGNGLFGAQGIFGTSYNSASSGVNSHAYSQGLRMSKTSPTNAALSSSIPRNRSDASLHKHIEAPLQPSAGTKKPVLLYVQDCSTWKRDEEHWLLPAIIATCRAEQNENAVASSLLGHALGAYGDQEAIRPVDATYSRDPELDLPPGAAPMDPPPKGLPYPYDPFQSYLLGEMMVSSSSLLGAASHQEDDHYHIFRHLPQRWEVRVLVIKQNFLFEYLPGEPKAPIGFIHLQNSTASTRLDNSAVVHLDCIPQAASSLAGASALKRSTSSSGREKHTTLIRARSPSQAARWVALFEAASSIKTEDLFEYMPIKPGGGGAHDLTGTALLKASELGRGRFAVVRRAKRNRYPSADGHDEEEDDDQAPSSPLDAAACGADPPPGSSHLHHQFNRNQSNNGRRRRKGEAVCALKIVSKAAFWTRVAEGKERHDTLVREVVAQAVLTATGHTGSDCPIVRLFSAFETTDSLVLELELMSRNDLFDELSTSGVLKEHKTAAIVHQVVRAVAFCAEHNIAHRDVKLSNIIFPLPATDPASSSSSAPPPPIEGATPASLHVKLADFGMAGFFGKDSTLRGRCGTPGYVAPEILCAGVNEGYGNNVDIFSVGVVAYTLLCGYEPFYGVTDKQLIAANKLAEYEFHEPEWTRISAEAKDLVTKMLVRDPRKRITPAQALEHPWLKRFSSSQQQQGTSTTTMEQEEPDFPPEPLLQMPSYGGVYSPPASPSSSAYFSSSMMMTAPDTPPTPGGAVSLLPHHRRLPSDALSRAADKTARLGSCELRSQYGSPLCRIM